MNQRMSYDSNTDYFSQELNSALTLSASSKLSSPCVPNSSIVQAAESSELLSISLLCTMPQLSANSCTEMAPTLTSQIARVVRRWTCFYNMDCRPRNTIFTAKMKTRSPSSFVTMLWQARCTGNANERCSGSCIGLFGGGVRELVGRYGCVVE